MYSRFTNRNTDGTCAVYGYEEVCLAVRLRALETMTVSSALGFATARSFPSGGLQPARWVECGMGSLDAGERVL